MDKQEKYKLPFATRLRNLLDERGITITALSKVLGISRQAVSQYADGTGQPNVEKLKMIADYFRVSTDYLVGLSEVPTRNETIQVVNDITGLWDDAISKLYVEKITGGREAASFLSFLVVHDDFLQLVAAIHQRNRYSGKEILSVDLAGEQYGLKMREMYKMLVSDLFFGILDDYTAGPGEIMTGYKKGDNNG